MCKDVECEGVASFLMNLSTIPTHHISRGSGASQSVPSIDSF